MYLEIDVRGIVVFCETFFKLPRVRYIKESKEQIKNNIKNNYD